MADVRTLLERGYADATPPPDGFERMLRRRDRKRRNQRIAAGIAGIGVFVAAVWIVTSGGWFDRTEAPAVPGGAETGPPFTGPTAIPKTGWDGSGIPPEETAPSTPLEGELIARHGSGHSVIGVFVYADGRVLWGAELGQGLSPVAVLERRLSPAAVELVRSGGIRVEDLLPPQLLHGIPTSAWVDAEAKLYVPSRYAVCFWERDQVLDSLAVASNLPASVEALLRGADPDPLRSECLDLTTQQARGLDQELNETGLVPREPGLRSERRWLLRDDGGNQVEISISPLFPDGRWWHMPQPHL